MDHYYEKFNQDTQNINDLLVMFMKDNPQDHFFIDEVPVTTTNDKFAGPDLQHLTGKYYLHVFEY